MKKFSFYIPFLVVAYLLLFVANTQAQQQGSVASDNLSGLVIPNYHYDYVPDFTYQEVETRIQAMETEMPFELNDRVFSFIQYFTVRNREYIKMVLFHISTILIIMLSIPARSNIIWALLAAL
jgi:membrane-bound lytic murein transglycosylase D